MKSQKPWYLSKGVMGAVFVVGATIAQILGYEIGAPESWTTEALILIGAVVAIIGRVKAVKRIKGTVKVRKIKGKEE